MYTIDSGVNWLLKEGNLPNIPIRWAIMNPENSEHVILATELGIWETSNFQSDSPNWYPQSKGLANVRVNMLRMRSIDSKLLAVTYGRGLYSSDIFHTGLSVSSIEFDDLFKNTIYQASIIE